MEEWRRIIGHDGYLLADLDVTAPEAGSRSRAVQSGYHAQWWSIDGEDEHWLGSGPLDIASGPSIKPGGTGTVRVYPMDPSQWQQIGPGALLHLRERVGQTLGVATVRQRVSVPDHAPLRLEAESLRPGAVRLVSAPLSPWRRLRTWLHQLE